MLDPATFLAAAQALPEGGRRRVGHDCGGGRTMVVDHKQDGWGAFCWRCNEKGWVGKPPESLTQRLARLQQTRAAEEKVTASLRPPSPTNFDVRSWPLEAKVWLYKAGLSNDRIAECGFYHHADTSRVVLPVFDGDGMVYWQARGFDKSRAKYINPDVDKTKLVAKYGQGDVLVLTEDILSAVRVGEVTEAWSILGTSLPDGVINKIARDGRKVVVWLDPDGPGRRAKTKVLSALRLVGVDVRKIVTARDPKLHSREEIAAVIGLNPATAT